MYFYSQQQGSVQSSTGTQERHPMAGRPLPEVPETPGQWSTASPLGTTYYNMTGSSFRTANSSFRTSEVITPEIPRLRLPYTIRAMPSLDNISEVDEDIYVGFNPGNKTEDTLPLPQDDDDLGLGITYVVASPDSTMTSDSDSDKKQRPIFQEAEESKTQLYEQILHQASDALMRASSEDRGLEPEVQEIIDQLTAIRVKLDKGSRLSSSTSGISSGTNSGNESLASLASKMIRKWEKQTGGDTPTVPPKYKNKNITVGPPGYTPAPQPVTYTRSALRGSISDLSTQSGGSTPSMVRVSFGGFIENKETDKKETGARPKTFRR